jgi:hypothetical protein
VLYFNNGSHNSFLFFWGVLAATPIRPSTPFTSRNQAQQHQRRNHDHVGQAASAMEEAIFTVAEPRTFLDVSSFMASTQVCLKMPSLPTNQSINQSTRSCISISFHIIHTTLRSYTLKFLIVPKSPHITHGRKRILPHCHLAWTRPSSTITRTGRPRAQSSISTLSETSSFAPSSGLFGTH